jgi:CubicO group peptidase (beta-lactamase class C family)
LKRFALLALLALTSNAFAQPVAERDIKAAGTALQNATILDTQKYNPRAPLAACKAKPLPSTARKLPAKLADSLKAAEAYSDAQKGVALVILQGGKTVHASYDAGANGNTLTASASMMKSVLALTVGIALDKRLIGSVDDPVELYLPEWKNDPRGKITLRQFLTMSSGLKLFSLSDPAGEGVNLLLSTDINAVALRNPPQDAPGTVFRYNNVNSQLVGIIVDRQARKKGYRDYRDFLERELWCPLGNSAGELWLDRENGNPHYFAGMHASIEDWARLGELIRQKGKFGRKQIVSAKWIAEMSRPSALNPNYGLHVWLGAPADGKRRYSPESPIAVPHSAPYLANDVLFFDGFGGQRVYVIPSKGITIARTGFTNLAYDDAAIVNLVLGGLE